MVDMDILDMDMVDIYMLDMDMVDMDMVDISKSRTFLAQFGRFFIVFGSLTIIKTFHT